METTIKVWMLSQFYQNTVHPVDGGTKWFLPVCTAYGRDYVSHTGPTGTWGLVLIESTPQQIEAAKQDPRVIVIGKHYARPPAHLLLHYASLLDPNETYQFMGQVLEKLAEHDPMFLLQ